MPSTGVSTRGHLYLSLPEVYIESRRNNGAWEFLGVDSEKPYQDERPLLVANTPEIREYHLRFWDKGKPNGDWSPVQRVTVAT